MTEDSFDHTLKKNSRDGTYVPVKVPFTMVKEEIMRAFPDVMEKERKTNRGELMVPSTSVKEVLSIFKSRGYDHFVALTCIDLLEEDEFELVYHLFSYGSRVYVYLKTRIDREQPSIRSVVDVFRPAITYEREIKEMFGVDFPGNPRLTQFILEDWEGPPPMRKDFDSIRYVQDTFGIEVRNPKGLPPKNKKGGGQ